ncbi:MmgE/PrpD family protein [Gracilibacillus sp. S3-1-1]|uniref:MmgE/PrpD family protein n=1 Tax=Gracilibacillus pellucidus TaxID=3095368 RepID=A0ACC6M916_9BACI|nr:MmgE/PrpD family protein [Gracilibacillus sp. S3-1-1]MDX8047262.1 MmgE/PrpD family protein [Gracilibacillus sp. S3-1-1]
MVGNIAVTEKLSELIVNSRPEADPQVMAAARSGVLDYLTSTIAGGKDQEGNSLLELFSSDTYNPNLVKVIGINRYADFQHAALLNGYLGHVLDYDDVHSSSRGHPSTVILPALFAISKTKNVSALDFLAAYVIGVETMCRLGLAIGASHYESGWHNTATLGAIAATAACVRLLNLNSDAVNCALGLAAAQSSGLRAQFGSDGKPLQAGLAARTAVFTSMLTAKGFEAASNGLDGKTGFFAAYGSDKTIVSNLTKDWGNPWQIVDPGLWFKSYPCCSASHHAIDAVFALISEHQLHELENDQIANIEAIFPPGGDTALVVTNPQNGIEGKFSLEYVIATALIDGKVGIKQFSKQNIEPRVKTLMNRINRRYDEKIEPLSIAIPPGRFTIVTITLKNGATYSKRVDRPHGAAGDPLTIKELHRKFLDADTDGHFAHVPDLVSEMETHEDLVRLITSL